MIKRILSGISILQLVIEGAIAQTLAPVSLWARSIGKPVAMAGHGIIMPLFIFL